MGKKKKADSELLEKMADIVMKYSNDKDTEALHIELDKLFCDTLRSIGYCHSVELFRNLDLWYA